MKRFASVLVGLVLAAVRALPVRTRQSIVRGLAAVVWALGIRRGVALDNVRQAFPEKTEADHRRIARGAYTSMGLAMLDSVTSDLIPDSELQQTVAVVDWKGLDGILARREPVLVASAHLGSWELFAEVMARRGHVFSAVVRPLRGAFNETLVQSRVDAGVELILQRGALKRMLTALERGRAVVQLIDQALPAKEALWVPFFGRLASTTPALSMAALKSGAPVFVVVAVREGDRLQMFVEGPIPVPALDDRREAIAAHTAELTAILERYIRLYPSQWLWLHRRWKGKAPLAVGSGGDQIASRNNTPA